MLQIQSFINRWLKPIISVLLVIILVFGYPSPALANSWVPKPLQNITERFVSFLSPSSTKGAPTGRQKGGAGRGRCPQILALDKNELPLTAFAPTISEPQGEPIVTTDLNKSSDTKVNIIWGQTIESHPTFWFYIPYIYNEKIKYGKFVLLDNNQEMVTKPIYVQLPDSNVSVSNSLPNIAKFTLPKTEQGLLTDKEYNWYFSVICNPLKPSRNPGVTGWIRKVNLSVRPPQSYQYYRSQGIWFDAVTRFIENTDLQNLSQNKEWLELIKFTFSENGQPDDNDDNLNQIANKIAKLSIKELEIVDNPELM